jgi:superfamily II DNA or RNA helicase
MLRPYQQDVRLSVFKEIRKGAKNIAVCMPTGAGKTRLAAQLIRDANSKGRKALFIVHLKTLVQQAASTFVGQGLNVGIMQADNTSYNEAFDDVIVASVQTLARRRVPDCFSLVVIDECHILYKKHIELMQKWNNLIYIGLSATPLRRDLGKYFDTLVNGPSVKELTENGSLVPVILYHPQPDKVAEIRNSLSTTSSPHGGQDFKEAEMEKKMSTARIVGDIVKSWKELAENRRTIVFAINKANSRYICEMFQNEGIDAAYIEDKTPGEERAKMFHEFEHGKLRVMCSVGVLSIGFDAPWVGCIVLARCTKSEGYHMQQVGRGLRAHPGKENCIILDHTGNLIEHGRPEDFRVDELLSHDRERSSSKSKKQKIVACKECGYVFESVTRSCPKCGVDRFGAGRALEVVDGELVLAGTVETPAPQKTRDQKKQEYLKLLWYAREYGYRDGWAFMKYRERNGGDKPAWAWKDCDPKAPPDSELLRWIDRSQRAWHASKGKWR